jgi:membrane protease YdiL (CAAX protease family)
MARAEQPADRRHALLRAVVFLAIAGAMIAACLFALSHILGGQADFDHPTLALIFAVEAALALLTALLPAALLRLATREPPILFGWGLPPRGKQMAIGMAGGLAMMALCLCTIAALGGLRFGAPTLPPIALLGYGAAYGAIFILVGIAEEGMLRGYALMQLSRAVGFWPATILTSLIFVALHLGHANETLIGLAQVGAFGLLMALSVRRTGGIWCALGFHAAWDFAETYLFGVPDSGAASVGSLITSTFSGPAWLTGGTAGPEGSLIVFLPLGLLALWLRSGRGLGTRA